MTDIWATHPSDLKLPRQEVHVWRIWLDQTPDRRHQLQQTLSPDEMERADRFHFEKDRNHYIVARGALRTILAHYLGFSPTEPQFTYTKYGKPSLVPGFSPTPLQFNVSHSNQRALCAVVWDREVGVDIEYVRTNLECEQIAEHFFSAQEIADLKTVPDQEKFQVFFNCWTRKEAYIKAIGQGLSMPLDKFDVTLLPDEPARLVNTRPNPHEADRWLMRGLAPGAGYVGALVVEGRDWQHRCWEFPDDEF